VPGIGCGVKYFHVINNLTWIIQEIIIETCKELDITALTLNLKIASENLILYAILLNVLIVNALSLNGEYS
jgi:hypothetical protein